MAANGSTRLLGRAAAGLRFDGIPPDVVEHLKLCVLDTLGCGLFGSTLPWSEKVARLALSEAREGPATLWGSGHGTTPSHAALANGTMAHAFELDDLHTASILHPGAVSVPPALALAERSGISGRDLLTAILAGYEVGTRIGMAVGTAHLTDGWHPTGTNGVFAAAAAAGKILGLDEECMTHALAIGGSQASGLLATQRGAMAKRFHAGRAAQSGVYAALLAQQGFTGAEDLLEADYGGYLGTYSSNPDPSRLKMGMEEDTVTRYETLNVGFKPYACGGSNHTSVEALQHLMREHSIIHEEISEVSVRTTTATFLHGGWPYRPAGVTAAQMNLSYCLAVTALDGDAFVDQFAEHRLTDPQVLAMISRIDIRTDPELDALDSDHRHAITLTVTTRDGRSFEARRDRRRGSSERALSRREVLDKFRRLAGKVVETQRVREIERKVLNLERVENIRELARLLRNEDPAVF